MDNDEEKPQPEQTVINIGSIDLHLAPDGQSAIFTFTLLGVLKQEYLIPPDVVAQFDRERLESKMATKKSNILLLPKGSKLNA